MYVIVLYNEGYYKCEDKSYSYLLAVNISTYNIQYILPVEIVHHNLREWTIPNRQSYNVVPRCDLLLTFPIQYNQRLLGNRIQLCQV